VGIRELIGLGADVDIVSPSQSSSDLLHKSVAFVNHTAIKLWKKETTKISFAAWASQTNGRLNVRSANRDSKKKAKACTHENLDTIRKF